jgi:hypothetical protein
LELFRQCGIFCFSFYSSIFYKSGRVKLVLQAQTSLFS